MRRMESKMLVAAMVCAGAVAAPLTGLAAQDTRLAPGPRSRGAVMAQASHPQDPADDAYRAARERLNRGEYARAAEEFERLRDRYPESAYVPDSYYWQAFALYRSGDESDLRAALVALEKLLGAYPEARAVRDARALETRVRGELARRGDAGMAEEVTRRANPSQEARGKACPEEDDDIRAAALNALLQMRSEQALPILKKILEKRDACSVELREKAVFLVAQHPTDETVGIMLDVVRNDPNREVREKAVFWLSQVHSEEALDALEGILRDSDDHEIQQKAIFAISQHGSPRAGRMLRDYAMRDDASRELREKAIFWIGQHGSSENAQFLRELYGSADDVELKEKIIFSLSQMGGRHTEWLLEIAVDPNEPLEARKKAIFWAGQSGISIVQLGQLYERMGEREIKEQLIFALSQRGEREAVDKLLDIARTETDQELRKKAIFWLSQSGDPRVAEFLLEIIEG